MVDLLADGPMADLIASARSVLGTHPDVVGAWVTGSLADGRGDRWSDLDLLCCVRAGALAGYADPGWQALAAQIAPLVLATPFFPMAAGGYCLTPDGRHIDLVVVSPNQLAAMSVTGAVELVSPIESGLAPRIDAPGSEPGTPYFPDEVVRWFFYMLCNLPVVVGRDEPVLGTNAVVELRDNCLVPLMLAEQGVHRSGGNKRQRAFLTTEQYAVLLDLPTPGPVLDEVISAERTIARVFIERARALAVRTGADWPAELEQATRTRLRRDIPLHRVL